MIRLSYLSFFCENINMIMNGLLRIMFILLNSGRRKSECFWIFIYTVQFLTVTTQQLLNPNKAKNGHILHDEAIVLYLNCLLTCLIPLWCEGQFRVMDGKGKKANHIFLLCISVGCIVSIISCTSRRKM